MKSASLPILLIACATVLPACGGDDTADGTNAASGASSSGGDNSQANGCTAFTAGTDVSFTFTQYTPACIKVAKGGTVTFKGAMASDTFAVHPLQGGAATETMGTPDDSSPIGHVTAGTEKAITFPTAGTFGFYCTAHVSVGMRGAVQVE